MSTLLEDTRYALRALARRPLYAIVTVLVFAIAIGANSTVFSVFNGLFLRPLPYPDGDRLVMVYDSYPKIGLEDAGTAIPDYLERRAQAASLEDLGSVTEGARTLGGDGPPRADPRQRARRRRCSTCCAWRRSSAAPSRTTRRRSATTASHW